MGRRRSTEQPEDVPPICLRFASLLKDEFGNSITQMAKAMEVSHTAVSRVVNQGQMPSGQMLAGLAKLGQVNLHWLLTGGEQSQANHDGVNFLPVSDHLLPGPPKDSPEKFDPLGLPTSSPFLLDAAYWYRVAEGSLLAASKFESVATGDYLLIECGPAWTTRFAAYSNRLVVLRHPERAEGLLARIGEEDYFDADRDLHFELNMFGEFKAALFFNAKRPDVGPRKTKAKEPVPERQEFFAEDVVGVVLEKRTLYGRKPR